jgi:hypothetical protein
MCGTRQCWLASKSLRRGAEKAGDPDSKSRRRTEAQVSPPPTSLTPLNPLPGQVLGRLASSSRLPGPGPETDVNIAPDGSAQRLRLPVTLSLGRLASATRTLARATDWASRSIPTTSQDFRELSKSH